jgi:ABC transporter substrate binding protein (PQQ-dependent alcohol dehydrogenase system)
MTRSGAIGDVEWTCALISTRKLAISAVLSLALSATAARALEIKIGYLRQPKHHETISLVQMPPANDGLAGAEMAIKDNNTSGRFLGQQFTLVETHLADNADAVTELEHLADSGISLVLADLPADALLIAADSGKARGVLVFNVGAPDDRIRQEDCRGNLVHSAPSRAMLADALAQYLAWKKWTRWVLVVGSHSEDVLYASALKRAAARFGEKIVAEREFKDTGGARQTDSGVVQVQQQVPVFTHGLPDYDVLIAADENEVFANYLPYRTWTPRPVAGSAGLVPTTWDPSNGLWGGVQMQNRFIAQFKRQMTALDMQAWTAGRMIGEAVERTNSADPKVVLDFIKTPNMNLGAYKGQKLTVRDWDLQLRQPILLTDGRTIVSVSPQEGFLHEHSELDTLGYDRPETRCKLQ